jgi:GT2 family glycosyltransferase
MLDLSILIVNWNVKNCLEECLESIRRHSKEIAYEIFVVDNHSTDDSIPMIEKLFPEVILIKNTTNVGFAKANNQAIKRSQGRYILLLNPDTVILPNSFGKMIDFMDSNSRAGVCGCRLINPDNPDAPLKTDWLKFPSLVDELMIDTFLGNFASVIVSKYLKIRDRLPELDSSSKAIEVDWISGSFLMVKREVVKEAGLMDEELFLYAEDMEWCYRIKRLFNWKIYILPYAAVVHYGGQSSKKLNAFEYARYWHKSRYRFHQKYSNNILFNICNLVKVFLFSISLGKWTFIYLTNSRRRKSAQDKIQYYTSFIRIIFRL